jgi:hypothetical protein
MKYYFFVNQNLEFGSRRSKRAQWLTQPKSEKWKTLGKLNPGLSIESGHEPRRAPPTLLCVAVANPFGSLEVLNL